MVRNRSNIFLKDGRTFCARQAALHEVCYAGSNQVGMVGRSVLFTMPPDAGAEVHVAARLLARQ